MKAYHNSVVLRNDGEDPSTLKLDLNAGITEQVTVRINSTQALASIFDVDDVGAANPLTTDNNGNYAFKAADNIYDIIVAEGTANEVKLEKVEIFDIPASLDLINDLSQAYEFQLVDDFKLSFTVFGVDKVIHTSDGANNGGEASWDIALTSTVTPNGDDIIQSTNVPTISIVRRDPPSVTSTASDMIGIIAGKMQAGEVVNIGTFGDSTTDGFKTTGWTANVIGTDHNPNAPEAWTLKLQTILRDMYDNTNIVTWNAGFDGQQMSNGWANDNYQAAMIDNANYGTPDVLFVQFGINDTGSAGSNIDDFVTQYRIFIARVIADGTTPVLMTTDAVWTIAGNPITTKEVQREINSSIRSLAIEFNIPMIDMFDIETLWLQNNKDGYNWPAISPDTIHFEDDGHSFKAQVPAMLFFNDAVLFEGGDLHISALGSQTAPFTTGSTFTTTLNNKDGGTFLTAGLVNDTEMLTMWVWNTNPDAQLVYLGIATEGIASTTQPSVDAKNFIDNTTVSKEVIAAGANYVFSQGKSDIPYIHGKLPYGLNKVNYFSSDASTVWNGGFKIVESNNNGGNCLAESGRVSREFTNASGEYKVLPKESNNLENVAYAWEGERVIIQFKATMPKGSGVIFMSGQGFDSLASGVTNNIQNSMMLFRTATDTFTLYNLFTDDLNAFSLNIVGAASAVLTLTDDVVGRIELYKNAGVQTIEVYDSYSGGALLNTFVAAAGQELRYAGHCGGIYADTDINPGANKVVELLEMTIVT